MRKKLTFPLRILQVTTTTLKTRWTPRLHPHPLQMATLRGAVRARRPSFGTRGEAFPAGAATQPGPSTHARALAHRRLDHPLLSRGAQGRGRHPAPDELLSISSFFGAPRSRRLSGAERLSCIFAYSARQRALWVCARVTLYYSRCALSNCIGVSGAATSAKFYIIPPTSCLRKRALLDLRVFVLKNGLLIFNCP